MLRCSLAVAPNRLSGLVVVKAAAIGLALYSLKMGKEKLLSRMNLFFAGLVAWNLIWAANAKRR